jgi:hypothetical protein
LGGDDQTAPPGPFLLAPRTPTGTSVGIQNPGTSNPDGTSVASDGVDDVFTGLTASIPEPAPQVDGVVRGAPETREINRKV